MNKIQTVRAAAEACIKKAELLYGVDLSMVEIRMDLKGVCAGIAGRDRRGWYLRFNTVMINSNGYDHIINDTVPHEVAHIVCFFKPTLGNNHNRGWARVCQELGGTGERCHNEEIVYAKGKTYEYTCSQGTTIRLSEQRHKRIQQRGVTFNLKKGGQVNKDSSYKVVGISGRPVNTTPQPIAAKKPTAPVEDKPTAPKLKKESKAERVRNVIRKCKANGEDHTVAEAFAVNILGMKPAQAKRYVKENWLRA